jgi:hypothetical protein
MGIVISIIGQAIGRVLGGGGGGVNAPTWDDLVPLFSSLKYAIDVISHIFDEAGGLAAASRPLNGAAGAAITRIGADVKNITEHTYEVVIPHSLAWLKGDINRTLITPLWKYVIADHHLIEFLLGWRGQIDSWRHTWVDPELRDWHGFHKWFDTWPISVISTWRRWFAHPNEFGDWAAAPITGPLIGYLAEPAHVTSRDNLTQIVVDAMPDKFRHVERAMLSILESPYP